MAEFLYLLKYILFIVKDEIYVCISVIHDNDNLVKIPNCHFYHLMIPPFAYFPNIIISLPDSRNLMEIADKSVGARGEFVVIQQNMTLYLAFSFLKYQQALLAKNSDLAIILSEIAPTSRKV